MVDEFWWVSDQNWMAGYDWSALPNLWCKSWGSPFLFSISQLGFSGSQFFHSRSCVFLFLIFLGKKKMYRFWFLFQSRWVTQVLIRTKCEFLFSRNLENELHVIMVYWCYYKLLFRIQGSGCFFIRIIIWDPKIVAIKSSGFVIRFMLCCIPCFMEGFDSYAVLFKLEERSFRFHGFLLLIVKVLRFQWSSSIW